MLVDVLPTATLRGLDPKDAALRASVVIPLVALSDPADIEHTEPAPGRGGYGGIRASR